MGFSPTRSARTRFVPLFLFLISFFSFPRFPFFLFLFFCVRTFSTKTKLKQKNVERCGASFRVKAASLAGERKTSSFFCSRHGRPRTTSPAQASARPFRLTEYVYNGGRKTPPPPKKKKHTQNQVHVSLSRRKFFGVQSSGQDLLGSADDRRAKEDADQVWLG